jgi:hypothetical protein
VTLRDLLDDAIARLRLCDVPNLLAVRKFLDGIEAQRRVAAAAWDTDLDDESSGFADDQHLTRVSSVPSRIALDDSDSPYEVEYDFDGGGGEG